MPRRQAITQPKCQNENCCRSSASNVGLTLTLELLLQLILPTTLLPLRLWSWVQRPPLFCTEPLLIELLLQMKLALRSFELFRVILCRLRE